MKASKFSGTAEGVPLEAGSERDSRCGDLRSQSEAARRPVSTGRAAADGDAVSKKLKGKNDKQESW
jgi:hypothetical protein